MAVLCDSAQRKISLDLHGLARLSAGAKSQEGKQLKFAP